MELSLLMEKLNKIPAHLRVRILYEGVPWALREGCRRRILDPAIKPIRPDMAVCGPAFTVADSAMSFAMLEDVRKQGCVLVIQTSGAEGTFVGDFMRQLAERDGVVGIVTDGYVTHAARLIQHDLPIFARGARIPDAGYQMEGTVQVPVTCGGVTVNPGDLVIGNLDGVLVLAPAQAEDMVEKAQWFTRVVGALVAKYMDQGIRYTDAPGVREYWAHKTSGSKNEDEFYQQWVERYGQ